MSEVLTGLNRVASQCQNQTLTAQLLTRTTSKVAAARRPAVQAHEARICA